MISMNNNITIYDISKKAEVSIATVSRVLNGSSAVKPKTRDKVLSVIEEYGYKPNAFARGLGLNSMKTIGILCADSSDLYLAKAVCHAASSAYRSAPGIVLVLYNKRPVAVQYAHNITRQVMHISVHGTVILNEYRLACSIIVEVQAVCSTGEVDYQLSVEHIVGGGCYSVFSYRLLCTKAVVVV